MLEAALLAGICSAGADVSLLGVVPTPAVAWASAEGNAGGAMISASHNPFADNGIKLFAPGGLKLSDDVESQIEDRYRRILSDGIGPGPTGPLTGTIAKQATDGHDAVGGWCELVHRSVSHGALADMRIVLDCANGASSELAPTIFADLGADVSVIGNTPDGVNINDGYGSTAPESLMAAVAETGAELGLAFDGDADRLIAVDDKGAIVDGDRVLGILANDWSAQGRLTNNTVVVTVMTNLGFHRAMAAAGIEVISTAVGDRYVLEALDDNKLSLGGEQSGHVICRDLATTGDGVLTGVQLADAVRRSGQKLSTLAGEVMTTVPQILRNVKLAVRDETLVQRLGDEIQAVEGAMGDDGRVLVRASGTEPLLRIMVEHIDPDVADRSCEQLVSAARRLVTSA